MSDWDYSIEFEAEKYKDQPFIQRAYDGLSVDRSNNHYWVYSFNALCDRKYYGDKAKSAFLTRSCMLYGSFHRKFWHTKRMINAKIVSQDTIHKHMIELLKPILLDLLLDRQPTAKDWKSMSSKNEKQVRRTEEYYPHMISGLKPCVKIVLYNEDGTTSEYPKKIVRKGLNDNRIKEITTAYSSPPVFVSRFDTSVFADEAYIRRQRRFWRDTLHILSDFLENSHGIRGSQNWLMYHIVNNDIALHVLFDNISYACELRWFENLSASTQNNIFGSHVKVYDIDAFKKTGLPLPYAFSLDHAKMAIKEHENFVTSFENEIPDNLCKYMIPQPNMKARIHDLILESAGSVKPYPVEPICSTNQLYSQTSLRPFADDWDFVCMDLASSRFFR